MNLRALIDTNILIHRESINPVIPEIGTFFFWLNKLKYTICLHPSTIDEIDSNKNKEAVKAFKIKLKSYECLKVPSSLHPDVVEACDHIDVNQNDRIDTKILDEVYCNRVDILVTEDKKIHKKALALGIANKVFSIGNFLEQVKSQYPDLVNYDVLEIRKKHFSEIDLLDIFFDSLKSDYTEFETWFNRKLSEEAYVLENKEGKIEAFLYLKIEDPSENYGSINPVLDPKKRLKIGTLKVSQVGNRLGERFLKIIFDNAGSNKVGEIYVTVFKKHLELVSMLEAWGFYLHGTNNRGELVYIKSLNKAGESPVNRSNPKKTYPFISQGGNYFIIPIRKEFHTDLFPDSILRGENANNFIDSAPHRNAISKCYISTSPEKSMKSGDGLVFYRSGEEKAGYKNIITTIGLVEQVHTDIPSVEELLKITRNKTVFTQQELTNLFNKSKGYTSNFSLFVIDFLYVGTLQKSKRLTLKQLIDLGIVDKAPRGIAKIDRGKFGQIVKDAL